MEVCRWLVLAVFYGFLTTFGSSQTIHRMAVQSDIRFRFATTEITCLMSNDDRDSAKEMTFDITLPKDAFIANFSMRIEGRDYPGNVKEKQEARQEYLAARRSGSSGGLVEQSARHSNKFDVSVNMAPGTNVTFTLIYQELLRRRFGSYEYSVYIDGKTLPKILDFSVEIFIQDRNPIRDVRTPAMRKEVISNVVEESQNSLTQITSPSENTVYVVYKPSPEELKEQGSGWFVVQYDVDSDSAGELLVVDGYFVHFFVPPDDLPPLPLDIVFVLDISGSMAGRKIEQLKDAMRTILDDLRETDRFNILLFDGSVQQWESSLQEASESNVDRAQDYVKAIHYRGSTNLHLALMRGLELLQGSREASRVPMIFFLTDGEATAGVQDSKKIVADVSRKNERVVNIYSLAFGGGADYKLLRQISAKNNGFARKIYEASDAAEQVLGLYREISTIVIRGLTVSYHSSSNNDGGDDDGVIAVDNSTITICSWPLLFGQSDFVVAGKLQNAEVLKRTPEKAGGLTLAVSGLGAKQQINFVLEENDLSSLTLDGDNPFWNTPRDLSKMAERTWAFLLIKQLLKEKVAAAEDESLVKELDKQILDLSLKYHFVTPLTSMVVTRPEDGLLKDKPTREASFTDDEDVPAAKRSHGVHNSQYSHSHRLMMPQSSAYHPPMSVPQHSMQYHGGRAMGPNFPMQENFPVQDLNGPSLKRAHTTSMTPPRTTQMPRGGKKKKRRRMNKKRKGGRRINKKGKKCIRNKRVFLQSVVVQGQQFPAACFELKAPRTPVRNYTLLSKEAAYFSVTMAMKRKFLMALHIHEASGGITVKVNSSGNLNVTLSSSSGPSGLSGSSFIMANDSHSFQFLREHLTLEVKIAKQTCKVSIISVSVDIAGPDNLASMTRKYSGIVARAFKAPRSKRRRGKAKKRRVPKGCLASNVAANRSSVIKGQLLLRYSM